MKPLFRPPNWLFTLVLTLFAAQLFGQNTKNSKPVYRYALKAYLNVSHEKKSEKITNIDGNIITTNQNETSFLPTVGFLKQKKNGRFTEISLTHFSFSHENTSTDVTLLFVRDSLGNLVPATGLQIPSRGSNTQKAQIGMRYEWNFPIFKDYSDIIQPFIAVSTDPAVFFQSIVPYTTASWPTIFFELRNTFSIIPKVAFNLSPRLFLDVQCPISVFSVSGTYQYEGNPILPTYARENFTFSSQLFPKVFNFRIGVGYKI